MKSILSNNSCEKKEKPFPKLMINDDVGVIILFSNETTGVVVHLGKNGAEENYRISEYADTWSPNFYEDYEGSVCLSND